MKILNIYRLLTQGDTAVSHENSGYLMIIFFRVCAKKPGVIILLMKKYFFLQKLNSSRLNLPKF